MGIASRLPTRAVTKRRPFHARRTVVPPLARLLLGDGSGLISNVNANTLGGLAARYATTSGNYPNMSVGTATFATTARTAIAR